MTKRKAFAIVVFALFILLVGRNLTFLPKFSFFSNSKSETLNLKKQIKELTAREEGNYDVYFSDIDNDKISFGINEHEIHIAASINKLPIVSVLYYLAGKGELDVNERITIQKDDIQDYGTGEIRYKKPGGVYSLKNPSKTFPANIR